MSTMSNDKLQKGFEQLEQMLGKARALEVRSQWGQISSDFEQFVLGVLASEVWTRTELDLRTRSLVTIAGLTAAGRPRALALNIEMALNNNATRQEIRETILQMAFYAGFPAAWEAFQIAEEIFRKVGDPSDPKP